MCVLTLFILSFNKVWGQNPDIRLNDRSQVIIPATGSNLQFCSVSGSNLQFQVHNESAGFANYIDLTTNSLIATLTIQTLIPLFLQVLQQLLTSTILPYLILPLEQQ